MSRNPCDRAACGGRDHYEYNEDCPSSPAEHVEVDPITGGRKGSKIQRYDLIPPEAMDALAAVYGAGADKYDDRNWERGYRYGLSFAALQRHLWAWWRGEDNDPESGQSHMAHVMWHAATLFTFRRRGVGTDDRTKSIAEGIQEAFALDHTIIKHPYTKPVPDIGGRDLLGPDELARQRKLTAEWRANP